MRLTKKDDQALATMSRIASYKPKLAYEFYQHNIFDDEVVNSVVTNFWENVSKAKDNPEEFKKAVVRFSADENTREQFGPLLTWLEVYNSDIKKS